MTTRTHPVLVRLDPKHVEILQKAAEQGHRKLANLAAKILRDWAEERVAKAKPRVNGHDHKVAKSAATA